MASFFKSVKNSNPYIILSVIDCLKTYFKNILYYFEDDNQVAGQGYFRTMFSSNGLAMRKRCEKTKQSAILLPFTNFRYNEVKERDGGYWTHQGYNTGVAEVEAQAYFRLMPVTLMFEATTWVNRSDDLFAVDKLLRAQKSQRKIVLSLANYLLIDDTPATINLYVVYGGLALNQFSDVDWLDKNKIQSVTHPFEVSYLDMIIDGEVDLVDKIKFTLVNDQANIINTIEL
jgi:hypothetical protein